MCIRDRSYSGCPCTKTWLPSRLITRKTPASSDSASIISSGCFRISLLRDVYKRQIFDRFYQADSSRSDKQHYGLGLSIAKELVQKHGGTISVGDSPSGGACFMVCLPVM